MESQTAIMPEQIDSTPETMPEPSPRPGPAPTRQGGGLAVFLAALTSGALLWAGYFPLNWGWVAWVALVPLLPLVRTRVRPALVYLCAWATGLVFYVPVLEWMRVADYRMYATWAMLALYCSLYVPAAVFLLRRLDSRSALPLCLTVPAVWAALEFLRSWLMTGFAWYFLGHTQHDCLPLIQVCDLGGVYAVTFLVAAVNALLFDWLYLNDHFRRLFRLREPDLAAVLTLRRNRILQTLGVAALLAAAVVYGNWRLGQDSFTPGPRVALLQGNLDQRLRNNAYGTREGVHKIVEHYAQLCRAAEEADPPVELMVWPETSLPAYWIETSPDINFQKIPADWRDQHNLARAYVRKLAQACCRTNVLFGLNTLEMVDPDRPEYRYNSALLVLADGKTGGRYDKIHRVPFGEYVPLRDVLPFMNRLAPYDFDYSIRQGSHLTRFAVDKYNFGVLICFEDTDPELARQYSRADRDGPAADFLVNISNDGWFDGASEHEQHLALCRFRAVEARRAIARSVNMGISAVIDGNGRVLRPRPVPSWSVALWDVPAGEQSAADLPSADWRRFKKVAGVLTASVPIDGRTSLYAAWGDCFAYGCWGLLALGLLTTLRRGGPGNGPTLSSQP